MEAFTWTQAQSMLSRWGWTEDLARSEYWVQDGRDTIMVPTVENLECRDEYDDFVISFAEVYSINPLILESLLRVESC